VSQLPDPEPIGESTGSARYKSPLGLNKEPGGRKIEVLKFTKGGRNSNWPSLLLVCAYIAQCHKQVTVGDVIRCILEQLKAKLSKPAIVSDAMEALRKGDILAEAQNAEGRRVFSMKRYKFNCSPELAEIHSLISELHRDSTGALIIEQVLKGPDIPITSIPPPEAVAIWRPCVRSENGLYGGNVFEGHGLLQECYYNSDKYHTLHETEADGSIRKDANGGYVLREEFVDHKEVPCMLGRLHNKIVITHAAAVRGMMCKAMEAYPLMVPVGSDRKVRARFFHVEKYMGFTDIVVEPTAKDMVFHYGDGVGMGKHAIQRSDKMSDSKGGGSAGLKSYEAIRPGTEFSWEFTAPLKPWVTPEEFKRWLSVALRYPIRSFSHARGNQVGTCTLLKLEYKSLADPAADWVEVP
jgi:hypothetical protein